MKSGALLPSNLPSVIDRSNLKEIKMKSGALLPSNLPSDIDRSNLSPSREEN